VRRGVLAIGVPTDWGIFCRGLAYGRGIRFPRYRAMRGLYISPRFPGNPEAAPPCASSLFSCVQPERHGFLGLCLRRYSGFGAYTFGSSRLLLGYLCRAFRRVRGIYHWRDPLSRVCTLGESMDMGLSFTGVPPGAKFRAASIFYRYRCCNDICYIW
jgi:hypothetical protein